jgi:hypothetical protein
VGIFRLDYRILGTAASAGCGGGSPGPSGVHSAQVCQHCSTHVLHRQPSYSVRSLKCAAHSCIQCLYKSHTDCHVWTGSPCHFNPLVWNEQTPTPAMSQALDRFDQAFWAIRNADPARPADVDTGEPAGCVCIGTQHMSCVCPLHVLVCNVHVLVHGV